MKLHSHKLHPVFPFALIAVGYLLIGCGGATGTRNPEPEGSPSALSTPPAADTAAQQYAGGVISDANNGQQTTPKVEINLYIMSRCPYGVQAIQQIQDITVQSGGEVGINIDYIGTEGKGGTLNSMHGDEEVQGDIDQLCGRMSSPTDEQFWRFISCVNDEWRTIPERDAECAASAQLDLVQFDSCRNGELGRKLLRSSFAKAIRVGATGSPTIIIDDARYSGNRTVMAISRYICGQFSDNRQIDYCKSLPEPTEVEFFAITDSRCGDDCDVSTMITSLQGIFMGLKPTVLDWSNPEAQAIFRAAGAEKLPVLLFGKSVEKDVDGFAHMQRWLTPAGPYYQVKVKSTFDPEAEVCDNGVDDTGNGKVDCADETCDGRMVCREEKKKSLEVFVMSQCPFGAMALLAMDDVLSAFKKKDMDFNIHFIATVIADDEGEKISSMHGQSEVDENMRWICARKHYPRDYLKYVWCRAGDYRNPEWEACATGKIKKKVLEKCVESGEGEQLLLEDMKVASNLDIGASPTWIANGRHQFSGVTPKAIQENFCEHNPGLSGCTRELSDERKTEAPAGACGN
jgi:hypothetical protein